MDTKPKQPKYFALLFDERSTNPMHVEFNRGVRSAGLDTAIASARSALETAVKSGNQAKIDAQTTALNALHTKAHGILSAAASHNGQATHTLNDYLGTQVGHDLQTAHSKAGKPALSHRDGQGGFLTIGSNADMAISAGMAAYSLGRAGYTLYEQINSSPSLNPEDREANIKKAGADLVNVVANTSAGLLTARTGSREFGVMGMLVDSGVDIYKSGVDYDLAMNKGDGYGAFIADNAGYIKAGSKLAMAALVGAASSKAGAAIGSIEPGGGTALGYVAGGAIGVAGSIAVEPSSEAIGKTVAKLMSENMDKPAELQKEADKKVNLKLSKDILAETQSLMPDSEMDELDTYADFHIKNGTRESIEKYDSTFSAMRSLVDLKKQHGQPIESEAIKNTLINEQERHMEAISKSPAIPLTGKQAHDIVEMSDKIANKIAFLEARPVLQNDPEAKKTRDDIMGTLHEAQDRLKPALAAIRIDQRMHHDFAQDSGLQLRGESEKTGRAAIAQLDADTQRWNSVVSGDREASQKFLADIKTDFGWVKPGTDPQLIKMAQNNLGIQTFDSGKGAVDPRQSQPMQNPALDKMLAGLPNAPQQPEEKPKEQSQVTQAQPQEPKAPQQPAETVPAPASPTKPVAEAKPIEGPPIPEHLKAALAQAKQSVNTNALDQSKTDGRERRETDGPPQVAATSSRGNSSARGAC